MVLQRDKKVTVIRSVTYYTCSVTLNQRALNCTLGNSKELSFIAERSEENMEDQLLSYMVLYVSFRVCQWMYRKFCVGEQRQGLFPFSIEVGEPNPFGVQLSLPNTHNLSSVFPCSLTFLYLFKMNTSLFHKHFPAPLARQELAQVQAHSRIGLGQLASRSHPSPYVFCVFCQSMGKLSEAEWDGGRGSDKGDARRMSSI